MRVFELVFGDSAGHLEFLLSVVRGGTVVRHSRSGKRDRHGAGQNEFGDLVHSFSWVFGSGRIRAADSPPLGGGVAAPSIKCCDATPVRATTTVRFADYLRKHS